MEDIEVKLIIPYLSKVRTEIRAKVDSFFENNPIDPPADYEQLSAFGLQLIERYGWGLEYFAFTMLCCGNAIWRKTVHATPYNRRILLIPECLKHSTKCKATSDAIGLLCNNCGQCTIPDIIKIADTLGYTVVVTQGMTLAKELLATGKIDALIGIGCIESLQRIFKTVHTKAIPALGIPLLKGGCSNTSTDLEWLKSELSVYRPELQYQPFSIRSCHAEIKQLFVPQQLEHFITPVRNKTEEIAFDILLAGGNRWRPFLASLVYRCCASTVISEVEQAIALSIECFHKASLVHDDIEDNDTVRNQHPTVHSNYGIPIGINTGDYLQGLGYKILAEAPSLQNKLGRCVQITSQGHVHLAIGQGEELLHTRNGSIPSVKEYLFIAEKKTGAAFQVALELGATIATLDEPTTEIVRQFSLKLGIAYQIQDDIADFEGEEGDVRTQGFSLLLSLLKENMPNSSTLLDLSMEACMSKIQELKIEEKAKCMLEHYIAEARRRVKEIKNQRLRLALYDIVQIVFFN